MALLREYAITPDVFDGSKYAHDDVCQAYLNQLKEVLLQEAVVRDLRSGDWGKYLMASNERWHRRTREVLKRLVKKRRLWPAVCALGAAPTTDQEWCDEAMASHRADPCHGIIASDGVADVAADPMVSGITRLPSASWWNNRSPSLRLRRQLDAYSDALRLIMRSSNSVLLIDPHLDPDRPGYGGVLDLLLLASGRTPAVSLEIHRACYRGSGGGRRMFGADHWESCFRRAYESVLRGAGLSVDVFIWDDMHDRYLISDRIGIAMLNGFDTSNAPDSLTTWTRLGRDDADDVQREFDPTASPHRLHHHFTVG